MIKNTSLKTIKMINFVKKIINFYFFWKKNSPSGGPPLGKLLKRRAVPDGRLRRGSRLWKNCFRFIPILVAQWHKFTLKNYFVVNNIFIFSSNLIENNFSSILWNISLINTLKIHEIMILNIIFMKFKKIWSKIYR